MNKWTIILLLLVVSSCGTSSFHRKKHTSVRKIRISSNTGQTDPQNETITSDVNLNSRPNLNDNEHSELNYNGVKYSGQNYVVIENSGQNYEVIERSRDAEIGKHAPNKDIVEETYSESRNQKPIIESDSVQINTQRNWFNNVQTRKQANVRLLLALAGIVASVGAIFGAFLTIDLAVVSVGLWVISLGILIFTGWVLLSYFSYRARLNKGEKGEKAPTFLGILAAVYLTMMDLGFLYIFTWFYIDQNF